MGVGREIRVSSASRDAACRRSAESDRRRPLHLRHRTARDALRRDPAQPVSACAQCATSIFSAARRLDGVRAAIDRGGRDASASPARKSPPSPRSILESPRDALALIKVEYEPLPFVAEMDAALKPERSTVFARGGNATDPNIASYGNVARVRAGRRRSRSDIHNAGADSRLARDPRRGRPMGRR